MKLLFNISPALKKGLAISTLFFFQSLAWAQEKKLDVDINVNEKSSEWYEQTWVWVAGGAIFIIIIVGLLRGRGSKD